MVYRANGASDPYLKRVIMQAQSLLETDLRDIRVRSTFPVKGYINLKRCQLTNDAEYKEYRAARSDWSTVCEAARGCFRVTPTVATRC